MNSEVCHIAAETPKCPTEATECRVTGALVYRDEFTIALRMPNGANRSWLTRDVDIAVDDPMRAHVEQLKIYTDADMHDVLAYLLTLQ